MNDVFPNKKAEFVHWFVNHHKLSSAASQWLLNKIKTKDVMERTYFVDDIARRRCSVVITTCDYEGKDGVDFGCYIDGELVNHRTFASYILKNLQENLYIHLRYKGDYTRGYINDVMGSENDNLQLVEIDIILKNIFAKKKLEELNSKIDITLCERNEEEFKRLINMINKIKEENPLL